jgi:hypothetical protein
MSDQIQHKKVVIFPDGRMDTKNAAAYLGLSEKTLAMMRCKGTGPRFMKVGGRVFYFQNHLDEFVIKAGFVTSTAQARAAMQVNNDG